MLLPLKTKEHFIVTCFLTFDKCLKDLQSLKFKAKQTLASLYNCILQQKILSKRKTQYQSLPNNNLIYGAYNRALNQAIKYQSQLVNSIENIIFYQMKTNVQNISKIYKNLNLIDSIITQQQSQLILKDHHSKQCRYYICFMELCNSNNNSDELIRLLNNDYKIHNDFLQREWKQISIILFENNIYENIEKINRYLLHISFESCINRTWIQEWQKLLPLLHQKRGLI